MPPFEIEMAMWYRGDRCMQQFTALTAPFLSANQSVHFSVYANAWPEVANAMLYRFGPDVSEVGSTWVRSLAASDALLPFPPQFVESLGGMAAFVNTSDQQLDKEIYSIPFQSEARLIFFRRDLLAKAGIDESTAFLTPNDFLLTLQKLVESGHRHPLLIDIVDRWLNLSLAVSWVWAAGGDFISENGKRAVFDQQPALQGLNQFLSCARYLPPNVTDFTYQVLEFVRGDYPIMLGGPWVMDHIRNDPTSPPHVCENLGIALPPGPPYKGGTNLVIWKHSRKAEQAKKWVEFLVSHSFQSQWLSGNLPARCDALSLPFYSADPMYQTMIQAVEHGRAYSSSRLWGVVEDRLSRALSQIWLECIQNPQRPPIEILQQQLTPLARRINITLEG
jgi:multiple sugar transport system substrate-binding protein